jgi:hypothetical protein
MGRAACSIVGFQHDHLEAMQGSQSCAAEPAQAAADHDQITTGGWGCQGERAGS